MSTKKSENERYKSLVAMKKHLETEIDTLGEKKKQITKLLSKYISCGACEKHFNKMRKTYWVDKSTVSSNGDKTLFHIEAKCPYCSHITSFFINKNDKK